MSDLIPAAVVPGSATETLGFTLRLESGRAIVEASDRPLGAGLHLTKLEMEIPNVKFPFDVSGGAERFKSQRMTLRTLVLQLRNDSLAQLLQHDAVREAGFAGIDVTATPGALVVCGEFRSGAFSVPFSFNFAPMVVSPRELLLFTYDERVYGPLPLPAPRLPWLMLRALGGLPLGASGPSFDLVGLFVRQLLPRFGWKIPETDNVGLVGAEISKQGLVVSAGYKLLSGAPAAMGAALAYESRAAFESAEKHLFAGEDSKAYAFYRAAVADETPARFAVRRLLQLAAAEETHAEEGRSLAEETLVREPQNTDSLLYLAQHAQSEGDLAAAARHFALLAEALWEEKSDRAAALADVAAAEVGRDIARPIARASVERTLQKRKNDLRALRMLFLLEREANNFAAAGEVGERLLRVLPEAERFDVHLQLGELFLHRDQKRAKLHAERALRAHMDDPRAMRLVAQVFAASGDPARAIRYLSRLAERSARDGDADASLALELEVLALLEQTSAEPPRALLQRYQRVLQARPDDRHALHRTAQLAFEISEFGIARRAYEELVDDTNTEIRGEAAFRLGDIALAEGRELEAEVHLESAITSASGDAAYHALVGIYVRRGDMRARYRLEDMLAMRTTDPARATDHHMRAAQCAISDRNSAAALKHLRLVLQTDPVHMQAKERLLEVLTELRDDQERERLLTEWAESEHEPQTRCEWYLQLAAVKETRGDLGAAKTALNFAVKADPGSMEANEALYVVSQKLGESYGAFEALGNIARYRSGNEEAKAEVRITQAELLAGPLGRRDEARAYLIRALADLPQHARGLWLLGELAAEAGDEAMAEDAWQRYLETGAEDRRGVALQKLAEWATARGDPQRASEVLQLWWRESGSIEARDALIEALKARGDFHGVADVLRTAANALDDDDAKEAMQWQTALVYRDSIGNWEMARRELFHLAESASEWGQKARTALVDLARDEGRSDLLAAALSKVLRFAPADEQMELQLAIARAHREAQEPALASAAYAWVLEHDPHEHEALQYIAEQAEEAGDYAVAFQHQLDLLAAGDTAAERALTRLTSKVSLDVLVQVISRIEYVPFAWAREMAARFASVGRVEASLTVLDKALNNLKDAESRASIVFEQLRLEEEELGDAQAALERMQAEYALYPDFEPYRDRYERLIERAGNDRQRAELALNRAERGEDAQVLWDAWETLRTHEPSHPRLAAVLPRLLPASELRPALLQFLTSEEASRAIGDEQRAEALSALHAEAPLAPAEALQLARLQRLLGNDDVANAIFKDLYTAEPTADGLFTEWLAGLHDEATQLEARALRVELAGAAFRASGQHEEAAHLLADAAEQGLLPPGRYSDVRDAFKAAGDIPRALIWAEKATDVSPHLMPHWLARFALALDGNEVVQAMTLVAIVEGHEWQEGALTEFKWQAAKALVEHEQRPDAERLLEEVLQEIPTHPDAYATLVAISSQTPSLLLPFSKRRAEAADTPEARADWLSVARATHSADAVSAAARELVAHDEQVFEALQASFELAIDNAAALDALWDWSESAVLALPDDGLRHIARICGRAAVEGNAAAFEIEETLVAQIHDKNDDDRIFLAQAWLDANKPEAALTLMSERALPETSSALLRVWLQASEILHNRAEQQRLLEELTNRADARDTERFALADIAIDGGAYGKAEEILQSLQGSAPADALSARLKTARARSLLDSDPAQALSLLQSAMTLMPGDNGLWQQACVAARKARDDETLYLLLTTHDVDASEQAELAELERKRGNIAEAARDLLAAFERDNTRDDWLRAALDALSAAGDQRVYAEALVRYADASPEVPASERLEEAMAQYRALGSREDERFIAERLFDLSPGKTSAFARLIGYVSAPGEEAEQLQIWVRHVQALPEGERATLALQAARFALDKAARADTALDIIAEEFGAEPSDTDALLVKVDALLSVGRGEEALPLLARVAATAATDEVRSTALRRAADLSLALGDETQAAKLWAAAVTLLPVIDDWRRKDSFIAVLELDSKAEVYRACLPLLPEDEALEALSELSHLSQALEDDAGALSYAQKALALDPESVGLRQRVRSLLSTQEDAHGLVQHLAEEHASSLDRRQRYALATEIATLCENRLGDKEQAEHFYRQAAKDDPTELAPLQALARLYDARGAKAEWCQTIETQLPMLPSGRERGELALKVGDARIELGMLDAAVNAYLHAFNDGISSPGTRKVVKTAAKRGVNRDAVLNALERLSEIGEIDERGGALRDMAELFADAKEFARAAELIEQASDFVPLSKSERLRLIDWAEAGNDRARAMASLQRLAEESEDKAERVALLQRVLSSATVLKDPVAELSALRLLDASQALTLPQTLALADKLNEGGERDASVAILIRALQAAQTPEAIASVKAALLERGEVDTVITMLVARQGPARSAALGEAAKLAELILGDADRAYALRKEALSAEGALPQEELSQLASQAQSRGDDDTLTAVYLRIAESDSPAEKRAAAYLSMARVWLDRHHDDERGEDCLRACLKIDPQNKDAVRALVDLLGRQNRGSEMAPLLKQLEPGAEVSVEERSAWALQSGRSALAAGDETTALEHFTAAAAQSSEALWAAFDLLVKRDEKAKAVALVEARLQQNNIGPGDLPRVRTAAEFARAIKSPLEATLLEKLADLAAADAKIYERLAALASERGDKAAVQRWRMRRAEGLQGAERASALIDIAQSVREDGDLTRARALLDEAFNLAPSAPLPLAALLEEYRGLGNFERMLVVGERLIIVDADADRPREFFTNLAEAAIRLGDKKRAVEFYLLAHEKEPLSGAVLDRASEAASGSETQRRIWEDLRLQQSAASPEALLKLGTEARDSSGDLARAEQLFRHAMALSPESEAPLRALVDTILLTPDRLPEAIDLYRSFLVASPCNVEAYRTLARLYGQVGDVDRTYVAYDALLAIAPGDDEAQRFVEAAHSILPELPARSLSGGELAQIADPGLRSPWQQFYGPIAAQAELLYPGNIARFGVAEENRLPTAQGLGRRVQLLAQRFGGRAPEVQVYLAAVTGAEATIEPGAPPKMVLAGDLEKGGTRIVYFTIGRAMAILSLGHLLPSRLRDADLVTTVCILAKRFLPDLSVPDVAPDRIEGMLARFRIVTPEDQWAPHREVARAFVAGLGKDNVGDARTWIEAGERTADRWALLMSGELGAAFATARQAGGTLMPPLPVSGETRARAIEQRADLLDLLQFALSDAYVQLRVSLGLTLARPA